jgi:signal transduction histidine kinase
MLRSGALIGIISILLLSVTCCNGKIPFEYTTALPLENYYIFNNLNDTVSPSYIYELLKKNQGEFRKGSVYSSGYSETVSWLAVNVKNNGNEAQNLIFEVGDPHIDKLYLYKVSDSASTFLGMMGDLEPFNKRPVANANFAFQFSLTPHEYSTLLLKIDNKGHTTMMPFSLTTLSTHYKSTVTTYLVWGLLTGILLFVCVFSLFIWLSVKEKLFLFYSLYILAVSMWIWSNNGLGYQFLYPDFPHVMARIRLVMSAFSLTLMLHVMQLFVKQSKTNSRFFAATNSIKASLILFAFILFIPYDYTKDKLLITVFLIVSDLVALGAVFLLFAGLIEKIKQGQRSAYAYLMAVSVFFIASIFTLLVRLGLIPATTLSLNGIYISILAEVLILSIAIGQRYNALKKEEQRLQHEIESQQKDMKHKLELAAITERNRIAADLHDEIGSGISGLRMLSEMAERKNSLEELKNDTGRISRTAALLANKIREVVWTLDSTNKNVEDFLLYAQKYGISYFENSTVVFSMEIPIDILPIELSPEIQKQLLLVIKEIFNNTLKHSGASKLDFITEINDYLSIAISDNGKGFSFSTASKGNGLTNIHNRIETIGGQIHTDTRNGVTYKIQIPIGKQT